MANEGSTDTTYIKIVLGAFRHLPRVSQIVVLSIVGIGLGMLGYMKFFHSDKPPEKPADKTQVIVQNSPQIYTNGTIDNNNHPGNADPQNVEADHEATEDGLAASYHMANLIKDNPTEVQIVQNDDDNYIHYKFFNEDKCLWINRKEAGVPHIQWVKDPQYHKHDLHKEHTKQKGTPASLPSAPIHKKEPFASLANAFDEGYSEPRASIKPRLVDIRETLEPVNNAVQGRCLDFHPGQFRYWWGQPFDQCNSPMFRQFPDGCMHYQIYNRCANSWDGRIFWTACYH